MRYQLTPQQQESALQGFREGNPGSLGLLFQQFYPPLCHFAYAYTGEREASEEIAGNAFIKVWERRENFLHYRILKSYLYITVRNECLNYQQKTRRQKLAEQQLAEGSPLQEPEENEENLQAESLKRIRRSMQELQPQCRRILEMSFFQGKKPREVARELGLTLGTVKGQKSKGILRLKGILGISRPR